MRNASGMPSLEPQSYCKGPCLESASSRLVSGVDLLPQPTLAVAGQPRCSAGGHFGSSAFMVLLTHSSESSSSRPTWELFQDGKELFHLCSAEEEVWSR